MQGNGGFFAESTTVDGSEIRRSPVEVGSFSHYLHGFMSFQTVVGWVFGISSSSTVVTQVILTISSFAKFHHSNNPPPPPMDPHNLPNVVSRLKLVKKPEVLLEMPADTVSRRRILEVRTGRGWWEGRSVGTLRYATATWNNPPDSWWVLWEVEPYAGWWFYSIFFMFIPIFWANDPIWRAYFSKGLVQPPTRYALKHFWTKMGW